MKEASVQEAVQCFIRLLNISWKAARPYGAEPGRLNLKIAGSCREDFLPPLAPSPSVTISSIAEEYRYIVRETCPCGGVLVPGFHATGSAASGHFDVINAACVECGSVRQFSFLIANGNSNPREQCSTSLLPVAE